MKVVLDTNILIDYLNGVKEARHEIMGYDSPLISIITQIEVLVGATNQAEDRIIRSFLSRFQIIPLNNEIAELTVQLRSAHRMKIPDAIIYATAKAEQCLLVTRNTKDFPHTLHDIKIPYKISYSS